MFDWHSLLDDAIAIAGALSASVFVYKLVKIYVMKPIHDTWDKFQRVIILSENIHSLLTPNGGSSLRMAQKIALMLIAVCGVTSTLATVAVPPHIDDAPNIASLGINALKAAAFI